MPRQVDRRKTERAPLPEAARSPQLQRTTIYLNVDGRSEESEAARALSKALGLTADQVATQIQANDQKGFDRAQVERMQGGSQNPDDDNAGYNRAWSQITAEADWNIAQAEIEQELQQQPLDEWDEAQVQAWLDDRLKKQFGGADKDRDYLEFLAPQVINFNNEVIQAHKAATIAHHQEKTASDIQLNLRERMQKTGQFDYAYLDASVGKMFKGEARTAIYAEVLFDMAIRQGKPELIDNMPERYASGHPTIKNNPKWNDKVREARNAAQRQAQVNADIAQAELDKANKQAFHADTMRAVFLSLAGEPIPGDLLGRIAVNPETKYTDIQSLETSRRSSETYIEGATANQTVIAHLWRGIYSAEVSVMDVYSAWQHGDLGGGEQANKTLQNMMDNIDQIRRANSREDSGSVGTYRNEVIRAYNPAMQGAYAALDPTMMQIQNEAVSEYNKLVLEQGMPPSQAAMRVREQFDATVDRIKPSSLSGSLSQSTEARSRGISTYTVDDVRSLISGKTTVASFVGGRSLAEVQARINPLLSQVTPEEREKLASMILAAYP